MQQKKNTLMKSLDPQRVHVAIKSLIFFGEIFFLVNAICNQQRHKSIDNGIIGI